MTRQQRAYLLMQLHSTVSSERAERLNSEILNLGVAQNEIQTQLLNIETAFNNGIRNLNSNQLNNLLKLVQQNGLRKEDIQRRLIFYEINEEYHEDIIQFFEDYIQSEESIDVSDLDKDFRGVQVASRDNFNKIINQGWTGDWVLTPENIEPRRIQVASMNDEGIFPRGYYLNADIIDMQPIPYDDQVRYRIFIANPIIINTGNRNVKFNLNPVRYIR